ncbi:uncharacterized protein TEOVI_000130500 [Trypanosoma equiperdum]|uniref:Uncharacterized protein n=2 Tax=Trypanozoon TaxID=39700 RepID=Q38CA4_TRYB2|nr:hypothetical protein, unlikely [Trypanosoma brucei brucei TREU927]EAN77566.1 hypothetical protein, unlikely [Trypanosoma brucei brucei TREU927]SCU69736.1 hypothetical protein, conserved [Trypanosoma equiperdum]
MGASLPTETFCAPPSAWCEVPSADGRKGAVCGVIGSRCQEDFVGGAVPRRINYTTFSRASSIALDTFSLRSPLLLVSASIPHDVAEWIGPSLSYIRTGACGATVRADEVVSSASG